MAVTDRAWVTLTVQVTSLPVHAPPHAVKSALDGSVASKVTVLPEANPYSQLAPQLMPPGFESTRPALAPVICTVSGWLSPGSMGQGASTGPSVPTAAVFWRVSPPTVSKDPATYTAASDADRPRTSDGLTSARNGRSAPVTGSTAARPSRVTPPVS